jgi:uncharacterized surface protein with fasciclin (FAS1) repeats
MTDRLNLIETIATQTKFSTFAKLMTSSGAISVLSGPGSFTVFVPTNEAFSKIPTIIMNELLTEPGQTQLKALLSYHIIPEKVMAASVGSMPIRNAVTGEELRFADSNGLKINGATIQARNIEATNGVIHSLDTVLAPSTTTTPASVAVAAAAASTQMRAVPAAVPSVTGSVTATAIPATKPSRTSTKPIF